MPFGGAVALTIMTTVYNNLLEDGMKMAMVWAFVAICPFMGICVLCAAGLGNVSIVKPKDREEEDDDGPKHVVTEGSYLLALMRKGKEKDQETDTGLELTAVEAGGEKKSDEMPITGN